MYTHTDTPKYMWSHTPSSPPSHTQPHNTHLHTHAHTYTPMLSHMYSHSHMPMLTYMHNHTCTHSRMATLTHTHTRSHSHAPTLTEEPFFLLPLTPPRRNLSPATFLPLPFFLASLEPLIFFLTPGPEKSQWNKQHLQPQAAQPSRQADQHGVAPATAPFGCDDGGSGR